MRIRLAESQDVAPLAALWHSRRGTEEEARTWAERSVRRSVTESEPYTLFVGERGEEVVAYGVAAHFAPPPGSPSHAASAGLYLLGLVVRPDVRRRGIGTRLVESRLDWIAAHASTAWYFADDDNLATIALHAGFGFEPYTTDFWFPGLAHPETPMTLYRALLPA